MRLVFAANRRSRHPLARALSVVLGLAVIGVLMVFGLFVAGVLLVGGVVLLAIRQWKAGARARPTMESHSRQHRPETLEGEFVVLHDHRHTAH